MYRAITWAALDRGVDLDDTAAVADLARSVRVDLGGDPDVESFAVNGVDVTAHIRRPEISAVVSKVATNLEARAELVRQQQAMVAEAAAAGGVVAEGRDITTVVAPDAPVRVLITASEDVRMRRRGAELAGRAQIIADEALRDQIVRRDRDDSTVAAFTEAAPGVVLLDSSELTLDDVIESIMALADRVLHPEGQR